MITRIKQSKSGILETFMVDQMSFLIDQSLVQSVYLCWGLDSYGSTVVDLTPQDQEIVSSNNIG